MFSIAQLVEETVKKSPILEEGLSSGIVNLSAVARKIKPQLEKRILKKTSISAIVMALQRLGKKLKEKHKTGRLILPKDVTVRSNLVELTYASSPTLQTKQLKALQLAEKSKDVFFNILQGLFESSIISSGNIAQELKEIFKGERLMIKVENLGAITLRYSEEALYTPGVYYYILKNLAWSGINVIEVISIHNELSLIFEQSKIDIAFMTIKELIST